MPLVGTLIRRLEAIRDTTLVALKSAEGNSLIESFTQAFRLFLCLSYD